MSACFQFQLSIFNSQLASTLQKIRYPAGVRITYITHTRFPTERAHGKQVAEVCSAMALNEHAVTLVCPTTGTQITQSTKGYYGLQGDFDVEHLTHFDALTSKWVPGPLSFAVTMHFYKKALKKYLQAHQADLVYLRSPVILETVLRKGVPTVLELHTLPNKGRARFVKLCKQCKLVVCLTQAMQKELLTWGVDSHNVCVEPDGVDLDRFENEEIRSDTVLDRVRKSIGIEPGRALITYTGSLVTQARMEKGVQHLVEAAHHLREDGYQATVLIVGGPPPWLEEYRRRAKQRNLEDCDIIFRDRIPSHDIPPLLAASDVLVYPAPHSDHYYFQRDTSPLKILEYLAAGKPIGCADLPPLQDILEDDMVTWCEPGNARNLASAIENVLLNLDAKTEQAREAREGVSRYDWRERMRRIVARCGS